MWLKSLAVDDPLQFCPDWRMQLGMIKDSYGTEKEELSAMADAGKAGFTSLEVAKVNLSFKHPFPESILRESVAVEHAVTHGRAFVGSFGSASIYEGDQAFSSKTEKLRALEVNRGRFEQGIDFAFPPDQPGQAKANAVFSHILRKGYNQAKSFLESLLPFHKMMTNAGLSESEAWKKVLTYVTAVFMRVGQVRTITMAMNDGTRLFGVFKAIELLDEFADMAWIRHPDLSSALVIAALQKDGKQVQEAMALLKKQSGDVSSNKVKVNKLEQELRNLKAKNPSWNT